MLLRLRAIFLLSDYYKKTDTQLHVYFTLSICFLPLYIVKVFTLGINSYIIQSLIYVKGYT